MSGNNNYIHKQIWDLDQKVHIKVAGLNNEPNYDQQKMINYIEDQLEDLDLRLTFDWNANNLHETNGGISFFFNRDPSGDSFGTRKVTAFKQEILGTKTVYYPYTVMVIRINLDAMDQFSEKDRLTAFLNICLHEFLHSLGVGHNKFLADKGMPRPLMDGDGFDATQLIFSYADKKAISELYGTKGRNMTFNDEDIGKIAHIIPKGKNKYKYFSFQIEKKEMIISGLPKKFKVVIK